MSERISSTQSQQMLQAALQIANEACDGASKILDSHFGNLRNLDEKFQAGLVSDADRESEKFIVDKIRSQFPDHAILGEESGLSGTGTISAMGEVFKTAPKSGALWMIDPLDGTTNFVHQFPYFNISIGLVVDGELALGVVDAPKLNSRWSAIKGHGAFLNAHKDAIRIHCSRRKEYREGLFSTGFSSHDSNLDKQMRICASAIQGARGIRRAGAAALDLCYVAQGVFDVFWEKNLSPWDMAAGVLIASEAGAISTDMTGQPFDPYGTSVVCGSPFMQPLILAKIMEL